MKKADKIFNQTIDGVDFLKESNAIEGIYDRESLDQALIAWEYLIKQDKLTIGVVLKTHKLLMLNQLIKGHERGYFRKRPVWIAGKMGLDHNQIESNIISWLLDVKTSVKIPGKAGRHIKLDHITYEKIHPFIDGNGRTGRMFLNWTRLKAGLPILVIKASKRQEYYKWFD